MRVVGGRPRDRLQGRAGIPGTGAPRERRRHVGGGRAAWSAEVSSIQRGGESMAGWQGDLKSRREGVGLIPRSSGAGGAQGCHTDRVPFLASLVVGVVPLSSGGVFRRCSVPWFSRLRSGGGHAVEGCREGEHGAFPRAWCDGRCSGLFLKGLERVCVCWGRVVGTCFGETNVAGHSEWVGGGKTHPPGARVARFP